MSWISKLFGRAGGGRAPSLKDLKEGIRQSPPFKDVSDEKIAGMLADASIVEAAAGDVIIHEGGEGRSFFVILEGRAVVLRRHAANEEPKQVAELGPGDSFGEEALISNATRNATVKMLTRGELLKVPKHAFVDYLMLSLVTWLTPAEAQLKIKGGARWVDVRDERSAQWSQMPNALFLPLEYLRERLGELDIGGQYVCYCENGRMSATAAFLMRQRGYHVGVLQGGLKGIRRGESGA